MKSFIFTLLFLGVSVAFVSAQKVFFYDSNDGQGIANLQIANADKSIVCVTSDKGIADLSVFSSNEELTTIHPGYETLKSLASEWIRIGKVGIKENLFFTQEVVVSANKWEQNKEEIPNEIVKLSQKDIAFKNPQTVADLVGNANGVYVQKSQLGGGSPMFRGFNANAVLMVIDGVRLNNAIYRVGNLQNIISMDAATFEDVEVIFGPGAVMYGSDALGGVMDFHTKKAKFSTDSNWNVSGDAFARYTSGTQEKTLHAAVSYGKNKWAGITSITYSDFGDLTAGKNTNKDMSEWTTLLRSTYVKRINGEDQILTNDKPSVMLGSGYSQWNVMQKFKGRLSENSSLEYAFHYSNSTDIPRYDRLVEYRNGAPRYAEWYYGPQTWMLNALTFTSTKKTLLSDQMKATLGVQSIEESRITRRFNKTALESRIENVNLYTFNLDFQKNLNSTDIFYGLDLAWNDVQSTANSKNIDSGVLSNLDTRYPDGGSSLGMGALYFNMKHRLNDQWNLQAGARYTRTKLEASFESKEFFDFPFTDVSLQNGAINGNIGINYHNDKGLQWNLLGSTGFRAPNVDDIGRVFESAPGLIVLPNTSLKPEYTYTIEMGVSKLFSDKIRTSFTAYYTYMQSAIVLQESTYQGADSILYDGAMSKVYSFGNTSRGGIYGANAQIEWYMHPSFYISSSYSYVYGRDKETDIRLHACPPSLGKTSLTYKNKKIRAEVWAQYQTRSEKFNKLSPEGSGKAFMFATDYVPSWYTLNIKASYFLHKNLQLQGSIENITDRYYIGYGSGIPGMGRSVQFCLRTNF